MVLNALIFLRLYFDSIFFVSISHRKEKKDAFSEQLLNATFEAEPSLKYFFNK